ncbi:MAG: prepilin-type N-terminal cleavage/methylation domain-containing protein [Candidatus Omnitrophota bacterium]|nr:prepilin-type N-terminal cleavage/methylation domain-containing protein [Candidatus Omnitrophota bacterium]
MDRKGFTLVEVLIVVIIIGILASIGIPQFAASIEKAKGGEARAGLGHIQTGEKVYYAEKEFYTNNIGTPGVQGDLDIILTQKFWTFTMSTPSSTTYIATATRSGGTQSGQTLTMDQAGTIGGTWIYK